MLQFDIRDLYLAFANFFSQNGKTCIRISFDDTEKIFKQPFNMLALNEKNETDGIMIIHYADQLQDSIEAKLPLNAGFHVQNTWICLGESMLQTCLPLIDEFTGIITYQRISDSEYKFRIQKKADKQHDYLFTQEDLASLLLLQAKEYWRINNNNKKAKQFIYTQPTSNKTTDAVLSDCEKYRYELKRTWDDNKPKVMFIMLNPSTADAEQDDPTIRRCINYAKDWGYGGIYVGNLFAFRATDPKDLLRAEEPIGTDNLQYLKSMQAECEITICAWGNGDIVKKLINKHNPDYNPLQQINNKIYCLELSNTGTPKHPLYLRKDLKPIKYKKELF